MTVVALHDAHFQQELFLWSAPENRMKSLASSSGLLSGGRHHYQPCATGATAIFCVEAAADVPPRLVRITPDGQKTVIDSPNPDPGSEGLLAETIAWQAGGSRASGVLIRPKVPVRLPLFITYYRCEGYLRGGVGDEWPLRALAAHGIATLCINAIPNSEGGEARYEQGLKAVESVVALLSKRGLVDPTHVGMGGLSFGSEVTMWTAMHSDVLKAASIASVQLEPGYYWYNARPGRETFVENVQKVWNLGSPEESPERWKRVSAALNTSSIGAPVLMQLPEQEARLSAELFSKLAIANMGEMHIFPLAPHIKVEPRQKLAAYQRNLDWFRYWLKGEIDPDPAKAAQYQRWTTLGLKKGAASTARTHRSASAISSSRK
jgi:dipeptidyl aminopeptidase/acylaminoacyl peptidase